MCYALSADERWRDLMRSSRALLHYTPPHGHAPSPSMPERGALSPGTILGKGIARVMMFGTRCALRLEMPCSFHGFLLPLLACRRFFFLLSFSLGPCLASSLAFSYSLPFLLAKGERGLGDSVFTQRGRDVLIHFTASYKGELTILPVLCARPSTVCARNEQRKQQRKQRPDVGPR